MRIMPLTGRRCCWPILAAEIEKHDEWPTDRGQRNLKQLITETCAPDLQIVRDRRSPAYIAVVTPEVRADVEAQIADRFADKDISPRAVGRNRQASALGVLRQRTEPACLHQKNQALPL